MVKARSGGRRGHGRFCRRRRRAGVSGSGCEHGERRAPSPSKPPIDRLLPAVVCRRRRRRSRSHHCHCCHQRRRRRRLRARRSRSWRALTRGALSLRLHRCQLPRHRRLSWHARRGAARAPLQETSRDDCALLGRAAGSRAAGLTAVSGGLARLCLRCPHHRRRASDGTVRGASSIVYALSGVGNANVAIIFCIQVLLFIFRCPLL